VNYFLICIGPTIILYFDVVIAFESGHSNLII